MYLQTQLTQQIPKGANTCRHIKLQIIKKKGHLKSHHKDL